jgi:hypothetical protein
MKTYSDNIRNSLILMIACLFVGGYNGSQAIGANPQPRRTTVAVQALCNRVTMRLV